MGHPSQPLDYLVEYLPLVFGTLSLVAIGNLATLSSSSSVKPSKGLARPLPISERDRATLNYPPLFAMSIVSRIQSGPVYVPGKTSWAGFV